MKMQTKILDAPPPFRIVPLKVPKGPLSRFSPMFARMFLAMFLTTPPLLRNSASPLRKNFAFFIAVQIVYQFICSFSQNSKCKSFFFPYVLGNITKNESKTFFIQ